MKHMEIDDRNRLEFLAACGRSANQIAEDRGRSPSAIRVEFIKHRIASDRGYGCSNKVCAHFDDCQQRIITATRDALRKNTPGCFESCLNFREAVCHRLTKFPYVCNGCERERSCPLHKKFYIASAAQAAYESLRSLSRTGVRPDDETIRKMNEILSPSVRNGQSVTAIVRANAETFSGFAPSTVYGWLEDGLFSARSSDLPYTGRRRKHHKRPETKTNAACRIGRTFLEMHEWLKLNPGVVPCELDTVIGSVSGKVLFTMIFPESGVALGFLRDAKTSQTCTRIFNMLDQNGVNFAFSNLNSYPRESLGGNVPHDLFVAQHGDSGKAFLDKLGIRRIPAAQVTLHPFLLGQKYQRAAERAILKKHGVIGQRKTEEKK